MWLWCHLFWRQGEKAPQGQPNKHVRCCWKMRRFPLCTGGLFPRPLCCFPLETGPSSSPVLFSLYPSVHACVCFPVTLALVVSFHPERLVVHDVLRMNFPVFSGGGAEAVTGVMQCCTFRAIIYCSNKWKYQQEPVWTLSYEGRGGACGWQFCPLVHGSSF